MNRQELRNFDSAFVRLLEAWLNRTPGQEIHSRENVDLCRQTFREISIPESQRGSGECDLHKLERDFFARIDALVANGRANRSPKLFGATANIVKQAFTETAQTYESGYRSGAGSRAHTGHKGDDALRLVFQETKEYATRRQRDFNAAQMIDGTRVYELRARPDGSSDLLETDPKTKNTRITNASRRSESVQTQYSVVKTDSFTAAEDLMKTQGCRKPLVLNMANKSMIGGGAEIGSPAQEEDLFRCSNYAQALYPLATPKANGQMRAFSTDHERREYREHIPEFGSVYTPGVTVFRDRGAQYPEYPVRNLTTPKKPFKIDCIAVAGYDLRATPKSRQQLESTVAGMTRENLQPGREPALLEAFKQGTKNKIRSLLEVAILHGHDSLVLGAISCGAFKLPGDPPQRTARAVANAYLEVLQEPRYRNHFQAIQFAIFDPENDMNYHIFSAMVNELKRQQTRLQQALGIESAPDSAHGTDPVGKKDPLLLDPIDESEEDDEAALVEDDDDLEAREGPNSQDAIALATQIEEAFNNKTRIEKSEVEARRAVDHRYVGTETSYEEPLQIASSNVFNNKVKPHYQALFNRYGNTDDARINAIFRQIKGYILEEIIQDTQQTSSAGLQVSSWIEQNKEALVNESHPDHYRILCASRSYLNNTHSLLQAAWRNFDADAPVLSIWPRVFVGERANRECRERLAYYYLAITDKAIVNTTEEAKRFMGQLMVALETISRAHNEKSRGSTADAIDDPSCAPGTLTRIGNSAYGHPIAEVLGDKSTLLPELIREVINNQTARFFRGLSDYKEKRQALHSFENICIGSIDGIKDNSQIITKNELRLRKEFLKSCVDMNPPRVNQETLSYINARLQENRLPTLTPDECSKVLYTLMDPYGSPIYLDTIKNQFMQSLSPEEQRRYQATQTTQAPKETLETKYNQLFAAEKERSETRWGEIETPEMPSEQLASFKTEFAPQAVHTRILRELERDGRFDNGNVIALKLQQLRKENLLQRYFNAFNLAQSLHLHKDTNDSTLTDSYQKTRTQALKTILKDIRLDHQTFTAEEEKEVLKMINDEVRLLELGGPDSIQIVNSSDAIETCHRSCVMNPNQLREAIGSLTDPITTEFVKNPVYFIECPLELYSEASARALFREAARARSDLALIRSVEHNFQQALGRRDDTGDRLRNLVDSLGNQLLNGRNIRDMLAADFNPTSLLTTAGTREWDLPHSLPERRQELFVRLYGQVLTALQNICNKEIKSPVSICPISSDTSIRSATLYVDVLSLALQGARQAHPDRFSEVRDVDFDELEGYCRNITTERKQAAETALLAIYRGEHPAGIDATHLQKLRSYGIETVQLENLVTQTAVLRTQPALRGYDPRAEQQLGSVEQARFQRLDRYTGFGRSVRQSLGVPNTGPTGNNSGVMGDQMGYPRMPAIHPYHPTGEAPDRALINNGIPTFSIAAAFPTGTLGNLPSGVMEQLIQHNIPLDKLDVFWSVQNRPWHQNEELLFRPHPWLHPNAPKARGATQNSDILVSICAVDAKMPPVASVPGISTHPDATGEMVYSADQMPILGLENTRESHAFYSLCIDPGTGRAALTLHWLLNNNDHERINDFASQANNMNFSDVYGFITAMLDENSRIITGQEGTTCTPLQALGALMKGGQPEPNPQAHSYRLGQRVPGSLRPVPYPQATVSSEIQRAHQLAQAWFNEHRFADETNPEIRKISILAAIRDRNTLKNPRSVWNAKRQKLLREPVSDAQALHYLQLLENAYFTASASPEDLLRLKTTADAQQAREQLEIAAAAIAPPPASAPPASQTQRAATGTAQTLRERQETERQAQLRIQEEERRATTERQRREAAEQAEAHERIVTAIQQEIEAAQRDIEASRQAREAWERGEARPTSASRIRDRAAPDQGTDLIMRRIMAVRQAEERRATADQQRREEEGRATAERQRREAAEQAEAEQRRIAAQMEAARQAEEARNARELAARQALARQAEEDVEEQQRAAALQLVEEARERERAAAEQTRLAAEQVRLTMVDLNEQERARAEAEREASAAAARQAAADAHVQRLLAELAEAQAIAAAQAAQRQEADRIAAQRIAEEAAAREAARIAEERLRMREAEERRLREERQNAEAIAAAAAIDAGPAVPPPHAAAAPAIDLAALALERAERERQAAAQRAAEELARQEREQRAAAEEAERQRVLREQAEAAERERQAAAQRAAEAARAQQPRTMTRRR